MNWSTIATNAVIVAVPLFYLYMLDHGRLDSLSGSGVMRPFGIIWIGEGIFNLCHGLADIVNHNEIEGIPGGVSGIISIIVGIALWRKGGPPRRKRRRIRNAIRRIGHRLVPIPATN